MKCNATDPFIPKTERMKQVGSSEFLCTCNITFTWGHTLRAESKMKLTKVKRSSWGLHVKKIGIFFFICIFCHEHSQFTGQKGKGEAISWTPPYHFHRLHRLLEISGAIPAESSPLHITSSRSLNGNLWFLTASH